MAPVKGVVTSLPEMDPLNPEKEQMMGEFVRRLKAKYGEGSLPQWWARFNEADLRIKAYKFLTARKWKMEDAEAMAYSTVEWREQHHLSSVALFPTAFPSRGYDAQDVSKVLGCQLKEGDDWYSKAYRLMRPHYQSGYHYWDKEGHPVLLMLFGQCDVRAIHSVYQRLAKVGEKATHSAAKYHIHENEVGDELNRYLDLRNQALPDGHPDKKSRRITSTTVLIDCQGLGYGHLWTPILDVVKIMFATDAAHYPEGIHRIFVLNCPGMIKFAYNIVKGALDPRVQQKVTFCSPDQTADTLRVVIDEDKIPKFLGGTCECAEYGGCVDRGEGCSSGTSGDTDALTEQIDVAAGTSLVKDYAVMKGEEIAWEFQSTTGLDIKFSATFHPLDQSPDVVVAEPQKLSDGSDRYCAPADGKLVLQWDNSSSWIRKKKLQMNIIKTQPACTEDDASGEDEEEGRK